MSDQTTVEFALGGTMAGKPFSAKEGLPFSRFAEFNNEVQQFVIGSDAKTVLRDVQVQIDEGSYLLRVIIPAGLLASLNADADKIAHFGALADVDRKRADVVLHWQERTKMDASLTYAVRSPSNAFRPFIVTGKSNFRREEKAQWVTVERYLVGEITDWGGAQSVNVHVRLRNSRDVVIVTADEDQIRKQRENLVYHKAIVHVKAKENPTTGELQDYRLIELSAYGPKVEESRLQQLFAKGAKAWANVPDAGDWVEKLRGGADA